MKKGLVSIDMLNDFMEGVIGNTAAAYIVEPIKSLLEAARGKEDWVVIFSNDAHKPGDLRLKVVVPSDATAVFAGMPGPYGERQQTALGYLANIYGAKIVTTSDLLAEMNR